MVGGGGRCVTPVPELSLMQRTTVREASLTRRQTSHNALCVSGAAYFTVHSQET